MNRVEPFEDHPHSRDLPPYRAVLSVDARGYSERSSLEQWRLNADIMRVMEAAFDRAGLTDAWQDRRFSAHTGDGYVLGLPTEWIPHLLHPFLEQLQSELEDRDHRRRDREPRLRLRLSIHLGPLPDGKGESDGVGMPMTVTHRLLDSEPVRRILQQTDETVTFLAVVVSHRVFEDVVTGGYAALRPAEFVAVEARVKGFAERAYLYVPRLSGDLLGSGLALVPADGRPREQVVHSTGPADSMFSIQELRGGQGTDAGLMRIQHEYKRPQMAVTIEVGSLFEQDAHVVVGFSDTFDTSTANDRVISSGSVQGQLLEKRYAGNQARLDRELAAALGHVTPPESETRQGKRHGKLHRYPIGTVAVIGQPGRLVFAVAYSRMGNDLVARSSVHDLWLSLDRLWEAIYQHGQRGPVAMPVLGSGLARIDFLDRGSLVKMILLSFVARSRQSLVARELRIVVWPPDLEKIDMLELAAFVRTL
ncbi:MAG TPA: macro domain-containing protein [Candidatus Dormibacteraeota bacterium]|nr:macro domain-containing protein [Candidatus Dormibacteraeota bacterium]